MIWLERALFVAGLVALGVFLAGYAVPQVQATQSIESFKQAKSLLVSDPDTSLWSPERIEAYEQQANSAASAIGVLRIDSVAIEAPIYVGSTDPILDKGIGWIKKTAQLGQTGNIGLSAHRDGFFRGLKDIEVGDQITVSSLTDETVYEVTATDIVLPTDTYVLDPTMSATLTLVTCYPFYFVGSAPNRFVVYAVAKS